MNAEVYGLGPDGDLDEGTVVGAVVVSACGRSRILTKSDTET